MYKQANASVVISTHSYMHIRVCMQCKSFIYATHLLCNFFSINISFVLLAAIFIKNDGINDEDEFLRFYAQIYLLICRIFHFGKINTRNKNHKYFKITLAVQSENSKTPHNQIVHMKHEKIRCPLTSSFMQNFATNP